MTTLLDPAATATTPHHEELRRELIRRTEAVIRAVATGDPHAFAQRRLVEFLRADLLPHAEVEADVLYAAAGTEPTALLARALQDGHRLLAALVRVVERASDPLDAAVAAGALAALFDVRVLLENQHLLPALAAADVDLGALLRDVPEITGDHPEE